MSKIVPLKDFAIPIPLTNKDGTPFVTSTSTDDLVVYYGPTGFKPDYGQVLRIVVGPVTGLTQKTVNGVACWDDPISTELPSSTVSGTYDFVFTLMTTPNGNEGDFSAPITAVVDMVVPPTLGQAVVLT